MKWIQPAGIAVAWERVSQSRDKVFQATESMRAAGPITTHATTTAKLNEEN
jgi:hypothetical protein